MVNQAIDIIQNHVSKAWSPPRVNKPAKDVGLQLGFALDIQVNNANGTPWDVDLPAQRARCVERIVKEQPHVLIGSPTCTALSALQALNKWCMDPVKWKAHIDKGERHMRFAVKLYRMQAESGRLLLHEHPNSATSWRMPEVVSLMEELSIDKKVAHMCRCGMMPSDANGPGEVKKATWTV